MSNLTQLISLKFCIITEIQGHTEARYYGYQSVCVCVGGHSHIFVYPAHTSGSLHVKTHKHVHAYLHMPKITHGTTGDYLSRQIRLLNWHILLNLYVKCVTHHCCHADILTLNETKTNIKLALEGTPYHSICVGFNTFLFYISFYINSFISALYMMPSKN